MRSRLVLISAVVTLLLAACGGGGSKSSPKSTSTTTVHVAKAAGDEPSESAKMICAAEAKTDIAQSAIGFDTIQPLAPKWVDHVYSCDYVYKGGAKMTLSVKELSNADETTAYFNSLAQKLGRTRDIPLAQGGFRTTNGSAVVRKDYKVLLVDVSGLPQEFGIPASPRGDDAVNVAFTVMNCWTGE